MTTPISFPQHGLRSTKDPLRTHSADFLCNHSASFHSFVLCLLSVLYINLRVLLGVSPVRTHLNTSSSPSYLSSRLQRPSRRSTPFSPDRILTGLASQISSTGTGTRPEYLILKLCDEEHVLVVVELKKAAEKMDAGMDRVEAELLEYIEDHFSKTQYPTIYGIGGIGFSWTILKVDRAGSNRPTIIVPWQGHITSNQSYLLLKNITDEIHAMSAQVWP